jgi:hypothetical protein
MRSDPSLVTFIEDLPYLEAAARGNETADAMASESQLM